MASVTNKRLNTWPRVCLLVYYPGTVVAVVVFAIQCALRLKLNSMEYQAHLLLQKTNLYISPSKAILFK